MAPRPRRRLLRGGPVGELGSAQVALGLRRLVARKREAGARAGARARGQAREARARSSGPARARAVQRRRRTRPHHEERDAEARLLGERLQVSISRSPEQKLGRVRRRARKTPTIPDVDHEQAPRDGGDEMEAARGERWRVSAERGRSARPLKQAERTSAKRGEQHHARGGPSTSWPLAPAARSAGAGRVSPRRTRTRTESGHPWSVTQQSPCTRSRLRAPRPGPVAPEPAAGHGPGPGAGRDAVLVEHLHSAGHERDRLRQPQPDHRGGVSRSFDIVRARGDERRACARAAPGRSSAAPASSAGETASDRLMGPPRPGCARSRSAKRGTATATNTECEAGAPDDGRRPQRLRGAGEERTTARRSGRWRGAGRPSQASHGFCSWTMEVC